MISQGKLCADTTAQQPNEELHLGSVKAARLNNELRTTDVSMQTVTSSHSLDKTMDIKDEGTQTNGNASQHGSLSAFGTPALESTHVHRVNKRPPAQQRNVSDRAPARERPPFYPPGPRSCREVDYTSESTRLDRIRHARSLYRRSYYLSIPASGTTRYKSNPCLSQCPKRSKSMLNFSQNSSYTGSSGQSQNGGPISHEQPEELQRSVSLRTIPPLTQDTMPDKVPYWSTLCMDQSPEAETQQLSDSLEPMAPVTVQQSPRRSPDEEGLTSVPDFIHLAESGNSKGTYRLDVTSTESLKRDLLNLHVQADELDRRWRNTDEAPESKKLNIFTSTARWTWPVRQHKDQFVSEKSFKLAFHPLRCTTRSVSAVSTSREILVPLYSTHPVHAATLRSTGPGQSLSIMQARIVYDLTFRPLQMETSMALPGGDEDSTKGIGSQVLTPRRARHKSRSHKIEGSSVDIRRNEEGSERRRSSSLGRRLLDAAVSHISFRRPRSRSKSRSRTSELEISGPIIAYPMTEICRQNTLLGPDEHTAPDNTDAHKNRCTHHIYSNEIGSKIQPKNPPHDDAPSETDSAQFRSLTPSIPPRSVQPADEKQDEPTILSRVLAPRDAYAETRCAVCLERVFLKDQYQLIDRVLHRSCFTCSVCGTELINRSAVCQHGIWSCFRHTQNDMTRTPVPTESAS